MDSTTQDEWVPDDTQASLLERAGIPVWKVRGWMKDGMRWALIDRDSAPSADNWAFGHPVFMRPFRAYYEGELAKPVVGGDCAEQRERALRAEARVNELEAELARVSLAEKLNKPLERRVIARSSDGSKGERAYCLRLEGKAWKEIGEELGLPRPVQNAKAHAKSRGLAWPPA